MSDKTSKDGEQPTYVRVLKQITFENTPKYKSSSYKYKLYRINRFVVMNGGGGWEVLELTRLCQTQTNSKYLCPESLDYREASHSGVNMGRHV